MLTPFGDDLFYVDDAFTQGPVYFPIRMTVARRADGGIVLWSPVAISDALAADIDALGPVRVIVAPNLLHHLWLEPAIARWPDATVIGVPGLPAKRPNVSFDALIDETTPPDTFASLGLHDTSIRVIACGGLPRVRELVLSHRPSRTLVVTDLVMNVHAAPNAISRAIYWMEGAWKTPRVPRLFWLLTRDRAAFHESLRDMLEEPFDRLIMAHGEPLPTDGRRVIIDALSRSGP